MIIIIIKIIIIMIIIIIIKIIIVIMIIIMIIMIIIMIIIIIIIISTERLQTNHMPKCKLQNFQRCSRTTLKDMQQIIVFEIRVRWERVRKC